MIGEILQDTYRIERRIGKGGMGTVFEVSHLRIHRRFAAKILDLAASKESLFARFRREALVTSRLGHPHIVEVVDFNRTDKGLAYLVMELLVGEDLAKRIARHGRLPLEQAAGIFGQAASALQAAHDQGVVHRDLKPQNIFLCRLAGRDDHVKVLDFGISKILGDATALTKTNALIGSPLYMAPEQAEGRAAEASEQTDVYALATMLYEMLCGRPPFAGDRAPVVLYEIINTSPTPLRRYVPELSKSVASVVHRGLSKRPEERHPSMRAFWEALVAAMGPAGQHLAETFAEPLPDTAQLDAVPALAQDAQPLPGQPVSGVETTVPTADRGAVVGETTKESAVARPLSDQQPRAQGAQGSEALADTLLDQPRAICAIGEDSVAEAPTVATGSPPPEAATLGRSATLTTPTKLSFRAVLRARGAPLYVFVVLAMTALLFATAVEAFLFLKTPETGLFMRTDGSLVRVDDRWPPFSPGTTITAINDTPVASRVEFLQATARAPHGFLRVTLERGGREHTVSAQTSERGPLEITVLAFRVLLGGACLFIGALAFFVRPATRVSWLFLLLCTGVSLVCLAPIGMARKLFVWLPLSMVGLSLTAAVAPHLFVDFPSRLRLVHLRPLLVALPYAVSVFVLAGCILGLFFDWGLDYGKAPASLAVITGVLVIALLVMQYRNARRADDALSLARCRTLAAAVLAGLLVPALLNAVRLFFSLGSAPLWANLNAMPIALFVGLTGFAIVRQNVLVVDRFTAAVAGYGVTLAAMSILFAAVLLALVALAGRTALFSSPFASVVLGAAAALGFMPLYRYLKRWVDRWFYRDPSGGRRTAETLRELAHTIHVADRKEVLQAAQRVGCTALVERMEIWFLSEDGQQLLRESSEGRPVGPAVISSTGPLGTALATTREAVGLADLAAHPAPEDAQAELWEHELALAAAVKTFGRMAGFVGAGRKLSGLAFSEEEESAFAAVASQLALLLERERSGSRKLGQYRIERRIGVGGMAEVFLAWQLGPEGFERKVALKRMLPTLCEDPDAVTMFLDEARLAAQLTHKNIVQIYEVGGGGNAFFVAMEYVDGPSLRELLRIAGEHQLRIPVGVALVICDAVLAALGYAHSRVDGQGKPLAVVHRDVTPANIHVSHEGEVKLLDFGIARATSQVHVTRTGTAKGTLPYMSPEQASGEPLDQRSDLYSLGAVLYELLSGSKAFPHGPTAHRPPPLTTRRDDIPDSVAALVERALSFAAAQRFADAAAMRGALGDALARGVSDRDLVRWLRELPQGSLQDAGRDALSPDDGRPG